ncbi:ribonuclease [Erythrobacter litoralis]|uniref:ribonuclease E/G n=1 Tax=Erythrobacter litoralis TaxID=39960 RepID=UPI00243497BD|nr:ribonuclease E/G [Erythrobacter litoralis]MDG6078716.1 ribonuclease [Erythrobacter litoralis]
MPEWLIERGIGEDRALLFDGDKPIAAKLRWPGDLTAGRIVNAKLVGKPAGSRRGIARSECGKNILLDRIPPGFTEGAEIRVQIRRDSIAERGRLKRPQGRVVARENEVKDRSDAPLDPFGTGRTVRCFPHDIWNDVFISAWSGEIAFSGGALLFSPTPAMTVIDIDGDLDPETLARRAVHPIARGLDLLDIGGQVGIDFPSFEKRSARQEIDEALGEALADRRVERTAMNGFGFVQLVSRLEGPSILQRLASHPAAAAARLALRRAELLDGPGTTLLTVHPSVSAKFDPAWIVELERRTGRPARIKTDANLALEASAAQIVSHE